MGPTLREAVEDHRARLTDAGLELRVAIPEQPLAAPGDRTRIMEIVANLTSNAVKFTPRGGARSERRRRGA